MVRIKPTPISDEALGTLKAIFTVLLSDKPLAIKMLDLKSGAEKLKLKLRTDFDQKKLEADMAQQEAAKTAAPDLSSRERMRKAGYPEEDISKIKKERAAEDMIPEDDDGLAQKRGG